MWLKWLVLRVSVKQTIDMSNFSKYIPRDLAKELLELGMPLYKYDLGSYDGKPYFDTDDEESPDWSSCDRYRILTYGEVIDWFSSKGIYITFDVFFTFALADNVAYIWKISQVKRTSNDIWLDEFCENDACSRGEACGGSFELDAQSAIKYAINLKKNI